ncbi:Reverse transcriptase domain [Dillenia turbinata]|uniref:Reverse transcriptase domain n=1 Tax=Dillenia turbinata TaxID=194707 RepID=A0AAN8W436_9MAGN
MGISIERTSLDRGKGLARIWKRLDRVLINDLVADWDCVNFQNLPQIIQSSLSSVDNDFLHVIPTLQEVHETILKMDKESVARPYSFSGAFFQNGWEVIGEDVYKAVVSFFCGADLPRTFTTTTLILIPKISDSYQFSQYRPISLCNFFNKIIAKILAERLSRFLPRLISQQQSGFVKGRVILDNHLLA